MSETETCPFKEGILYIVRSRVRFRDVERDDFKGYYIEEYTNFYMFKSPTGYRSTMSKVDYETNRYIIEEEED